MYVLEAFNALWQELRPRTVAAMVIFALCMLVATIVRRSSRPAKRSSTAGSAPSRRYEPKRAAGNVVQFGTRRRQAQPPISFGFRLSPRYQRAIFHPLTGLIAVAAVFYAYEAGLIASPLPRQADLVGRVTHVRDGDTIEVAGTPVRFAALDCAELGTVAGDKAKRRMQTLAAGKRVTCDLTGRRSYDRVIGECSLLDGTDLSPTMIREGYCSRW